jgi:hypothetical protein
MRRNWPLNACFLAVLAVVVIRRQLLVVVVHGNSMTPMYADGDTLLAVRQLRSHIWCAGDVLVFGRTGQLEGLPGDPEYLVKQIFAVPGDPVPHLVKRAVADSTNYGLIPEGSLVLKGTNRFQPVPSFYFVSVDDVLGTVVCRLRRGQRQCHGLERSRMTGVSGAGGGCAAAFGDCS